MKQILITLFIMFLVSLGFSQKSYSPILTEAHTQVVGTKLHLLVPDGYEQAVDFTGLTNEELAVSIIVMELPFGYQEIEGLFEQDDQLAAQGMELVSHEYIDYQGQSAELVEVKQSAQGLEFGKFVLIFGDTDKVVMVNSIFPVEMRDEYAEDMREIVLSAVYDSSMDLDPEEALSFQVDTEGTKMQFASTISGAAIYTTDGNVPTKSEDETVLIVANSLGELHIEDRFAFAEKALRDMPTIDLATIVSQQEVEINGVRGVKLIADAENEDGTISKVIQIVLFSNDRYYRMIGVAEDDFDANISMLETIMNTFRIK